MTGKTSAKALIAPKATLALADGTIFHGLGFGAVKGVDNAATGEMVFNTSMYGYQEIMTDPSYAGQMICFTSPHIGNVGCNDEDLESRKVFARAAIVRDLSPVVSNFRAQKTFSQFLEEAGVMGISSVDTRQITCHLRDHGAQMGAMACGDNVDSSDLVDIARSQGSMLGKDYVCEVSCSEPYTWNESSWSLERLVKERSGYKIWSEESLAARPHVIAVDCGIKYYILRLLVDSGFRVTVVPATATAQQILALNPDALFLSNGPGDPATLQYIVSAVKELLGRFPVFGICLGHQILGQALGGSTFKLKFGHRGGNHPVMDLSTRKVEVTVQNHGFAVEAKSLPSGIGVSHVNLNDQTVEGLNVPECRAFSVQYHPESSPGPLDARYLFKRFFEKVVTSHNA